MCKAMARRHGYVCYLLYSARTRRTYTGITCCLSRRMRQHNGLLVGGSRYTSRYRPWRLVCYVTGFRSQTEVLRFEWRCKRVRVSYTRNPLVRAMQRFGAMCSSPAWWVAPRSTDRSLGVHFCYQGPERPLLQQFERAPLWRPGLLMLPRDVLCLILQEYLVHGAYYARLCGVPDASSFACCAHNTICALCHT